MYACLTLNLIIKWSRYMFQDKYLPIIVQEVNNIRKTYGLNANSPIGDYIFAILKNECILVEWPEEDLLDLDGFSTEKVVDGRLNTIVYINSAKNKEKQNFCAAHELGHRHKLERLLQDAFPDDIFPYSTKEDIMNRFAAELMMPSLDFKRRAKKLYNQSSGFQDGRKVIFLKKMLESIVELMDFYYVPYKSVVIRFYELNIISDQISTIFQDYEKTKKGINIIDEIIREQGVSRLRIPDRKIQYSVRLENIHKIAKNKDITKYMTTAELKKYLKAMGIAEEDIQLIEDMKKIETETIDVVDNNEKADF